MRTIASCPGNVYVRQPTQTHAHDVKRCRIPKRVHARGSIPELAARSTPPCIHVREVLDDLLSSMRRGGGAPNTSAYVLQLPEAFVHKPWACMMLCVNQVLSPLVEL